MRASPSGTWRMLSDSTLLGTSGALCAPSPGRRRAISASSLGTRGPSSAMSIMRSTIMPAVLVVIPLVVTIISALPGPNEASRHDHHHSQQRAGQHDSTHIRRLRGGSSGSQMTFHTLEPAGYGPNSRLVSSLAHLVG